MMNRLVATRYCLCKLAKFSFNTALKFSPNHPYATANFVFYKIKFAINWHRRPRRNKSNSFPSLSSVSQSAACAVWLILNLLRRETLRSKIDLFRLLEAYFIWIYWILGFTGFFQEVGFISTLSTSSTISTTFNLFNPSNHFNHFQPFQPLQPTNLPIYQPTSHPHESQSFRTSGV